ncbi:MAG: ACT domain-containing protein [Isosphaeraceae bacterium]
MEMVHELTARLENKPGRLAKICSTLASEKINIRALVVMDSSDRSVLRLVTDQVEATRKVFNSLGVESELAEVLTVEMEDRPGSLARVLERLAEEHINVDYAYLSSSPNPGRSLGVFRTANMKKAQQVLTESANGSARDSGGRRPLHVR